MASGGLWTDERIERLKTLHAQGLPYSDIAAKMGISRSMVSGKLARLGLKRPDYVPEPAFWTDQRCTEMKELFAAGLTDRDIAERLGCSAVAIEKKRSDLGLKRKPKRAEVRNKPVLKIVAANGHTSQKVIIETVVADMRPLRCVEVEPLNIALLDLEPHHCRYPTMAGGVTTYCGHQILDRSYCHDHFWLCYPPRHAKEAA